MLRKFWVILWILCNPLLADEGISQASAYKNNSSLQWQLAMEGLKAFYFNPDDHVLDVGCGDGKITAWISSKVPDGMVEGMDISERMVFEARTQFGQGNLSFFKASAEAIPFSGRFDKLVSFSTLHWVLDQKGALQSMKESLKPGGAMLLVLPLKSANNLGILGEKIARSEKWAHLFPVFKTERIYFTLDEYKKLLNEVGLDVQMAAVFLGLAQYKDREALIGWIAPLMNFTRHLPEHLQREFVEEMADEVLCIDPPDSDGTITIRFETMKVIAKNRYK